MNRFAMLVCLLLAFQFASAQHSTAQTFSVGANFDGEVVNPQAALLEDFNGNFEGTSLQGGFAGYCGNYSQWGCGTIYFLGDGYAGAIYSFCSDPYHACNDGELPNSALLQATNGNLYGTTQGGDPYNGNPCGLYGCGTVFEYGWGNTTGPLTTLHTFSYTDGSVPTAGLIQARDGSLYGTTTQGGTHGNYGTVFRITPAGKFITIYNFCAQANCADGYSPSGPLLQVADGSLYGVTEAGGANKNAGTVFKITPQGVLTTLYSFCVLTNCRDGVLPIGGLIQATDGNFYGTANAGGAHKRGTLFRITPGGKLTTLYSFCALPSCGDGSGPSAGVIEATDGNLYGTTYAGGTNNSGTIFQFTSTGKFSPVHSFCSQASCTDGAFPMSGLIQDTNGLLDGVTSSGGLYYWGISYTVSLGVPPFVRAIPNFGKVGSRTTLTGLDFSDATSVSFNGVPAVFTIEGSSQISATVPGSATSGKISVVTAVGTINSAVAFRVIP